MIKIRPFCSVAWQTMTSFGRGIALAVLLMIGNVAAQTETADFVHTDGTRIVQPNGDEVFFHGINLGNWLLWEGYLMMGDFEYRTHSQYFDSLTRVFGSKRRAAEFQHQWRMNYVDQQAIADLSSLGFNSVRVPFHHNLFWSDGQLKDDGFQYIDRLVSWCRQHGMLVLLDMHAAPGFQNPGDHADNTDSNAKQPRESVRFWDDHHVEIAAKIWSHIADHYKDEPVIWGYDLINEPVPQHGREYELLPSMVVLRDAVRKVDANHIIVAEGSWWGSDLSKLDWKDPQTSQATGVSSAWDSNLVYELHHYGPAKDTVGRERFAKKLNVPIILGECGETDADNLQATTAWARENLSGCFPWSFKKMSHDKALWTVPPNQEYRQLTKLIKKNEKASPELFDKMIQFAKENIRNGHASHQWHQDFYDAVKE